MVLTVWMIARKFKLDFDDFAFGLVFFFFAWRGTAATQTNVSESDIWLYYLKTWVKLLGSRSTVTTRSRSACPRWPGCLFTRRSIHSTCSKLTQSSYGPFSSTGSSRSSLPSPPSSPSLSQSGNPGGWVRHIFSELSKQIEKWQTASSYSKIETSGTKWSLSHQSSVFEMEAVSIN